MKSLLIDFFSSIIDDTDLPMTFPQFPSSLSVVVQVSAITGILKAKLMQNLFQLMAMNLSADPCDNFFEYACGQWNRDHMIPDDMFAYGTFASVRENVRQQMRGNTDFLINTAFS